MIFEAVSHAFYCTLSLQIETLRSWEFLHIGFFRDTHFAFQKRTNQQNKQFAAQTVLMWNSGCLDCITYEIESSKKIQSVLSFHFWETERTIQMTDQEDDTNPGQIILRTTIKRNIWGPVWDKPVPDI